MKYLKTYEQINEPIKVGDYAIVTISSKRITYNDVLVKIIELKVNRNDDIKVKILNHLEIFDNANKKDHFYLVSDYQINYWSESKEELEVYIDSNKYNL